MSKGVIHSITLDKTVILEGESAEVTVDYTASGSDVFTLDDFVNPPSYLKKKNILTSGNFQQEKITTTDDNDYDRWGRSVAISGDYAIVGAKGWNSDAGKNTSVAYIFKSDGSSWVQQQKLEPEDVTANPSYFSSVAISGDYAIIGCHYDDNYRGSVCIFKKEVNSSTNLETWRQKEKLTATKDNEDSDAASFDEFGYSVAIDGEYAIVGAAKNDENGTDSGAAYIFKKDDGAETWTIQKKLTATKEYETQSSSNDYFGYSVAISGDYAIVGAHGYNEYDNTRDTGSAYIFKKSNGETWTQQKKLTANDAVQYDNFGYSVAISGDYVIVGVDISKDDSSSNAGSAYIFYGQGITLTPPDDTVSLKKLEIKTNNWTGVTESDYFLINTYSGQGSGIMTVLYNTLVNSIKVEKGLGSGVAYTSGNAAGSNNGYTTGYAAGSGNGYTTGYAAGSGAGYTAFLKDIGTITVHPGWNIFSAEISGSINDTHNIIIDHTLQYFNGTSYEHTNKNNLERGRGYMVKCKGSGSFIIL